MCIKASISFVILTWNSERYIENCLKSIIDLEGYQKEIFIVDNGSVDNTRQIASMFLDSNIKMIELEKNYGTTYSRNIAIKKRNREYDYLCILDSDTVVNTVAFDKMIEGLQSNESFGLIGPSMKNLNGELQISYRRFPTAAIKFLKAFPNKKFNEKGIDLEKHHFVDEKDFHEVDYVISACWLIKNEVVEKVGLLDERLFYSPEDCDYCFRVWKNKYKVVYSPESLIIHDTQRISKKKFFSKINLSHVCGLIYYFYKHKYFLSADKAVKRLKVGV